MKIEQVYTSYFYQIRYFTPDLVPLSTAVWDPKWYHNFKSQDYSYIDKRGVICGLRVNQLHPDKSCDYQCVECQKTGDPNTCDFIQKYKAQLQNINFENFMFSLEHYMDIIQKDYLKTTEQLTPIFIVHEAIGNACSERGSIQQWFNSNGVKCCEWPGTVSRCYN